MIAAIAGKGAWVSRWEVESLTTDKIYIVGQKPDGSFGCDCPAWRFHKAPRPDCKHIMKVKVVEGVAIPTAWELRRSREEALRNKQIARVETMTGEVIPTRATPAPAAPVYLLQTKRRIRLED